MCWGSKIFASFVTLIMCSHYNMCSSLYGWNFQPIVLVVVHWCSYFFAFELWGSWLFVYLPILGSNKSLMWFFKFFLVFMFAQVGFIPWCSRFFGVCFHKAKLQCSSLWWLDQSLPRWNTPECSQAYHWIHNESIF